MKIAVPLVILTGVTMYSVVKRKKKPSLFIKNRLPFGLKAVTVPPIGIFIARENITDRTLITAQLENWKIFQDSGLLSFYLMPRARSGDLFCNL